MIAIISTGDQVTGIETVEDNIFIESFIDGDMVMEECDLVICHGGNGTIYQALQHGKPIIGIPTIPDQKFNMRRVEALGIGRMLSWKEFSNNPGSLLKLIKSIIKNKSFFQNASRFKDILSTYNAPKMAADIVLKRF